MNTLIITIPVQELRLPCREHLSQAFARFFRRVGLSAGKGSPFAWIARYWENHHLRTA